MVSFAKQIVVPNTKLLLKSLTIVETKIFRWGTGQKPVSICELQLCDIAVMHLCEGRRVKECHQPGQAVVFRRMGTVVQCLKISEPFIVYSFPEILFPHLEIENACPFYLATPFNIRRVSLYQYAAEMVTVLFNLSSEYINLRKRHTPFI